jgi:hypothetical protein
MRLGFQVHACDVKACLLQTLRCSTGTAEQIECSWLTSSQSFFLSSSNCARVMPRKVSAPTSTYRKTFVAGGAPNILA